MKNISILGSTGSIGQSTLEVVDSFAEKLNVTALACGKNQELLFQQVKKYKPSHISLDVPARSFLQAYCKKNNITVHQGEEGLVNISTLSEVDILLAGMSGTKGLVPVAEAIKKGKKIALANKETLVMAGKFITDLARTHNVSLLPVDSEHNAIFQCLKGERAESICQIILCASGGPFLNLPEKDFSKITLEQALKHPRWEMGPKITIDSATLMNKGLEMIEAKWLFDLPSEKVGVVVHPQSLAHSMVEFVDGSIIAQIGKADMAMPIQYCLSYPERWPNNGKMINLASSEDMIFQEPDYQKFPALTLAKNAMDTGGSLPAVLNAADEEAVLAFLNKKICFTSIMEVVERIMDVHESVKTDSLEEIIEIDRITRIATRDLINKL